MITQNDVYEGFMREAIKLAYISYIEGDVPVGAVVVKNGKIIGKGRNHREKDKNAIHHAEIEAISNACKTLGGWRLSGCELYVTLEPCPMCAGAAINSRIDKVIYGCKDKKAGSVSSVISLFELPYNHKPNVIFGVLEKECAHVLQEFFKELRN